MVYARFPIEEDKPAFPDYGNALNTNAMFVCMSPALQDAGFTFTPPQTRTPVRFTCTIDLAPDGRVQTLLMNSGKAPEKTLLPWRLALLAGHAKTNGYGRIRVEWREPRR